MENITNNIKINYAKENHKERIIVNDLIDIPWSARTKSHFISLGYKFTSLGERFQVKVTDLLPSSTVRILVECPLCGDVYHSSWLSINSRDNTLCKGCVNRIDISGMKFGRLTVISPDNQHNTKIIGKWICKCECGKVTSVAYQSLMSGQVVSCSCYRTECISSLSGEDAPSWKGGPVKLKCDWCSKDYYVIKSRKNTSRFCSIECYASWTSENMVGPARYNYNPDLTDNERHDMRSYHQYRQWRRMVFKRDDYTCQCCNKRGVKLNAHHLFSYAHYPQYRIEIDNGVTLCDTCHDEFHFCYMGGTSRPCTPQDYIDWLSGKLNPLTNLAHSL